MISRRKLKTCRNPCTREESGEGKEGAAGKEGGEGASEGEVKTEGGPEGPERKKRRNTDQFS